MEFLANKGKNVEVEVAGDIYLRHAIQTHFVTPGESYLEIMRQYVLPIYREGDFVSISEKIIALCQNRIVKREDLKCGFWAKVLSKCASRTAAGVGISEAPKMQYAINKAGLPKVLYAAAASAVTKMFGRKGVFFEILGQEIAGLDGFYDGEWSAYRDIGIEIPENPFGVCNEIAEELGISCMIVDANDLGQEILGFSDELEDQEIYLKDFIKDNPAGQGRQRTPIILIRKI